LKIQRAFTPKEDISPPTTPIIDKIINRIKERRFGVMLNMNLVNLLFLKCLKFY